MPGLRRALGMRLDRRDVPTGPGQTLEGLPPTFRVDPWVCVACSSALGFRVTLFLLNRENPPSHESTECLNTHWFDTPADGVQKACLCSHRSAISGLLKGAGGAL